MKTVQVEATQAGNQPGGFLFPFHSPTPAPQWGGGSGPNGAVGAEMDGSAVCFTLLPIPDKQINLHSSPLMKVPHRLHLLLLFSSLAPTLSSCGGSRFKIKIKRDPKCLFLFILPFSPLPCCVMAHMKINGLFMRGTVEEWSEISSIHYNLLRMLSLSLRAVLFSSCHNHYDH